MSAPDDTAPIAQAILAAESHIRGALDRMALVPTLAAAHTRLLRVVRELESVEDMVADAAIAARGRKLAASVARATKENEPRAWAADEARGINPFK